MEEGEENKKKRDKEEEEREPIFPVINASENWIGLAAVCSSSIEPST